MDQLLRDPIWQFVGVAISLVALVVAVVAIRAQQQRKSLGYYFASDRPILYIFDEKLKDRLTLSLDGQPVRGLSTYEVAAGKLGSGLAIKHAGTQPTTIRGLHLVRRPGCS